MHSTPKSFRERHFIAVIFLPLVVVLMMVSGGFRNIDIWLHESRTTATVTGLGSHGVILYRYAIGNQTYSGSGDPGNPPYPVGSTFPVRYSTAHPSFSVARHPFILFGQVFVGCLFLLGADFMINRQARKRENADESIQKAE